MLSGCGNWVQVITSRGVKVAGLLGPAAAMEKKSSNVADTPVGIGGTNQWKLAGLVGANHITDALISYASQLSTSYRACRKRVALF